jgi:sulfite reductase alpha subunit-like flavoprotein
MRIPLWISRGTFRMPPDTTPLILIGPGTGCAAIRAIIQDRIFRHVGNMYFFFGCRYRQMDFLYENEWSSYVKQGFLQLFAAFSRDQKEKVYVQHRLSEQKDLIWRLINEEHATIFLSGSARQMPKDVKHALKEIWREKEKQTGEHEADKWLQHLEKEGRFQMETW